MTTREGSSKSGGRALRTSAAEGFRVLGTMLTFDNKFDVEVEYRLSRANNAFYANSDLLGCVSVPLKTRLRVFRSVVDASVFWCAGSWNLSREKNERLRTFKMSLLRQLLRVKRLEGEDMGTFLHRATGTLKYRLANVIDEHETWGIKATQLRSSWGGHVARLLRLDPTD